MGALPQRQGVVLLDSSAGTAAYPLAAIEFALRKVEGALGPGAVAEYATRCARNVYAFEVQVGPYAVSHLRLTKLLADAGATLPPDGLHVLLTDTLESPHVDPPQPPLMAERLTEEQRRARRVKADVPVFVSMGNPPYFREQAEAGQDNTRGKWVRFGDSSSTSAAARRAAGTARPILDDFVDLAPAVHVKNLYNLYVYFWRWTLWKMFEQPGAPRRGIISFITASSYLRGPGFAGMRQRMREAFDELWIIDLEGNSLGTRKTENVFAIQTPVCIAIGARYAETKRHELARVRYAKFEGTREAKLERLAASTSFSALAWQDCFEERTAPLLPMQAGDYFAWPQLTDIWPWQHSGVELKRTWPIGETPAVLAQRWRDNDNRLASRLRPALWAVQGEHQIFLTSMLTGVLGAGPAVTATVFVPDRHHFRGSFSGKDVIPLWRDAAATAPNLPATLLACLGQRLGVEVSAPDLFAYTYGLLSATSYTEMYSEELTLPPLRLPISADAALFAEVAAAGRQLLWWHTYGERFVPAGQLRGRLPPGRAKSVVGIADAGLPESFEWVPDSADAGSGVLHIGAGRMAPVSRAVWEFGVSGYQVLPSWLSSRMQRRSGKRSSTLDELRPQSWDATLSQELRELIWVLEATVNAQPRLNALLAQVVAGPIIAANQLPVPTELERLPARDDDEAPVQQQLI